MLFWLQESFLFFLGESFNNHNTHFHVPRIERILRSNSLLVDRVYDRKHPDVALAMCLFDIVWQLERPSLVWRDLRWRSYVMGQLGRAASLVRTGLFRALRSSDAATRQWQDQKVAKIANALLEKQRWLTTPMRDTQDALRAKLAGMLLATLKGEWDNYEVSSKETAGLSRAQIISSIPRFAQKVLAGFLPLGLVVLNQEYFLVSLEPSVNENLHLGSMVWAAVSLLLLVDPRPDEKLATIKNAFSVTRLGDKKPE
jgi:hypothetical protein